jgi:hypothetical protein
MVQSAADLQQLKGVGRILAKRLYDAGFDSFSKIVQEGEDGLKKVRGITPQTIKSIVEQARQLAEGADSGEAEREETVKRQLSEVRELMQSLAEKARDRFEQELSGKTGKKLSADLLRIEDALVQMGNRGPKRAKRTGKALVKAEKRMTGLEEGSLKKIRKGVKRARKAVIKAL